MTINNTVVKIIIIALIIFDLSALDDITTGNEPDLASEYAMLIFSALAFAAIHLKRNLVRESVKQIRQVDCF